MNLMQRAAEKLFWEMGFRFKNYLVESFQFWITSKFALLLNFKVNISNIWLNQLCNEFTNKKSRKFFCCCVADVGKYLHTYFNFSLYILQTSNCKVWTFELCTTIHYFSINCYNFSLATLNFWLSRQLLNELCDFEWSQFLYTIYHSGAATLNWRIAPKNRIWILESLQKFNRISIIYWGDFRDVNWQKGLPVK